MIGTENVEDFLGQLAEYLAAMLRHAAGAEIECGVTLQRRTKSMTVTGSSQRAVILDRIEQSLGDGPCMADGDLVTLDVLRPETRRAYREIAAAVVDGYV